MQAYLGLYQTDFNIKTLDQSGLVVLEIDISGRRLGSTYTTFLMIVDTNNIKHFTNLSNCSKAMQISPKNTGERICVFLFCFLFSVNLQD